MPVRELLHGAGRYELDRRRASRSTLVAHGEVVVVNEKFGIRLTDVVSATERMEHAQ
jgi:hypothetical protein